MKGMNNVYVREETHSIYNHEYGLQIQYRFVPK